MPIKSMTDRATLKERGAFTRLGKLFKGSPKKKVTKTDKQGKPYEIEIQGDDLDYFRFESQDALLAETFSRLFGKGRGEEFGQPGQGSKNAIPFVLPDPDMEKSFPSWMMRYRGGSCWIKCDKEFIYSERVLIKDREGKPSTRWIDYPSTSRPPCRFPDCDKGKKGMESCGADGTLRIVLPQLQRYGVVELGLHAKNDLPHVSSQIADIEELAIAHGLRLHQMPLLLYRETRSVSSPSFKDGSQRQRVDKSLVNVVVHPMFYQRSLAAQEQFALASASNVGGDRLQLAPMKSAQPDTTDWHDQFGPRPDLSWMRSQAWQDVKIGFEKARTTLEVDKASDAARAVVKSGGLPNTARTQIDIAADAAQRRIDMLEPSPEYVDAEIVPEISNVQRFEAVARLTKHSMSEIEAIAKTLKLPEDVSQWTDFQCQKLRNRLYAFCAEAIASLGSSDIAGAEYQDFINNSAVDFGDDLAVWEGWKAIALPSAKSAPARKQEARK